MSTSTNTRWQALQAGLAKYKVPKPLVIYFASMIALIISIAVAAVIIDYSVNF